MSNVKIEQLEQAVTALTERVDLLMKVATEAHARVTAMRNGPKVPRTLAKK